MCFLGPSENNMPLAELPEEAEHSSPYVLLGDLEDGALGGEGSAGALLDDTDDESPSSVEASLESAGGGGGSGGVDSAEVAVLPDAAGGGDDTLGSDGSPTRADGGCVHFDAEDDACARPLPLDCAAAANVPEGLTSSIGGVGGVDGGGLLCEEELVWTHFDTAAVDAVQAGGGFGWADFESAESTRGLPPMSESDVDLIKETMSALEIRPPEWVRRMQLLQRTNATLQALQEKAGAPGGWGAAEGGAVEGVAPPPLDSHWEAHAGFALGEGRHELSAETLRKASPFLGAVLPGAPIGPPSVRPKITGRQIVAERRKVREAAKAAERRKVREAAKAV